MQKLIDGFHRFKTEFWPHNRALFEQLAQGQTPHAIVIACSNSRIDPQMIFNTQPGEIFTVRNVANLVPPYAPDSAYHGTSAALEFAVRVLQVRQVVVLGHSQCGGVRALLEGEAGSTDFVLPWMQIAQRARSVVDHDPDPAHARTACEHECIKVSLENLRSFPWIRDREAAGQLGLHGLHFDIEAGALDELLADGSFRAV